MKELFFFCQDAETVKGFFRPGVWIDCLQAWAGPSGFSLVSGIEWPDGGLG